MPSSISASSVRRATCLVIAGCVTVVLGIEAVARVGFDRMSRIQRRTVDEYQAARTIGHGPATDQKQLLLVGNSLLEEDVRFEDLRAALFPRWNTRRFVAEQTFYIDWYYGMKRLFRVGARPDVVVLMLST